ncbi:hypothetical protein DITRI_Ditri04bG0094100 [Diplodiscus trichospermus]
MLVKIVQDVQDERKARPSEKKSMIDLFMEVEDDKGNKLEDEEIVNLLLLFLRAGHESSASAATWATIFLHDNPETLKKAKVIDETLRIVNLLYANFRVAKVDANINGHFIPKGWKVLVWNREVHLNSENHENPKDFRPS